MTRYGRSLSLHGIGRALVYDPVSTPMYPFKAGEQVGDTKQNAVLPTMPYLWQ